MPHVLVGNEVIGGAATPDRTEVNLWVVGFDAPVGISARAQEWYVVLVHWHGAASFSGKISNIKVSGQNTGEAGFRENGATMILDSSLE